MKYLLEKYFDWWCLVMDMRFHQKQIIKYIDCGLLQHEHFPSNWRASIIRISVCRHLEFWSKRAYPISYLWPNPSGHRRDVGTPRLRDIDLNRIGSIRSSASPLITIATKSNDKSRVDGAWCMSAIAMVVILISTIFHFIAKHYVIMLGRRCYRMIEFPSSLPFRAVVVIDVVVIAIALDKLEKTEILSLVG